MAVQNNYGTGRRKSAVARVFLKPGKGEIVVNGKPVDEFFSRETGRMIVRQPLQVTDRLQSFDISVNVCGGGESGQAGAVRHGITRALIDYDAALKPVLKKVDYDPLASGPESGGNPRWRNAAQWARNSMIRDGRLKSDSPRGIWEISEAGRAELKSQ